MSNLGLWVRDLDSLEARRLPGTQNASSPFWSPDGKFVAFADGRTLKKIDVSGGPPQTLGDAPTTLGMGAWSRDGVIVIGTRGLGPMYRVSSSGGVPVPLTVVDAAASERGHSFPTFLPDQKRFLYVKLTGQQSTQGIYVGSIDAAPEQQDRQQALLAVTLGPLAVLPSREGGRLLFMRDSTLMSQPFDVDRVRLSGDAQSVAERIAVSGSFAFFGAAGECSPIALVAQRVLPMSS